MHQGRVRDWFLTNPVPEDPGGFRFIGTIATITMALEMLTSGEISQAFEVVLLGHDQLLRLSAAQLRDLHARYLQSEERDRLLPEIMLIMILISLRVELSGGILRHCCCDTGTIENQWT